MNKHRLCFGQSASVFVCISHVETSTGLPLTRRIFKMQVLLKLIVVALLAFGAEIVWVKPAHAIGPK